MGGGGKHGFEPHATHCCRLPQALEVIFAPRGTRASGWLERDPGSAWKGLDAPRPLKVAEVNDVPVD